MLPPVAQPTGSVGDYCGKSGSGDHSSFKAGDHVEINSDGLWYQATITRVNSDGTFAVGYKNGRTEVGVKNSRLRKVTGFELKQWVEAKWKGYDKWYVAQVTARNSDGTYNVVYKDDGVLEESVPRNNIRQAAAVVGPKIDGSNDAVCELAKKVGDLHNVIDLTGGLVQNYMSRASGQAAPILNRLIDLGPPLNSNADAVAQENADLNKRLEAMMAARAEAAASPAPAPKAAEKASSNVPVEYGVRDRGSCRDFGGHHIKSRTECWGAAATLKMGTNGKQDEKGGVKFDPPHCYVEGKDLKYDSGENGGKCNPYDKCLCIEPNWPGFSRSEPRGACLPDRDEDGGKPVKHKKKPVDCYKECLNRPDCAGFQTGGHTEKHCQLFFVPVKKGTKNVLRDCWLRSTAVKAPAPAPAAAAADESILRKEIDKMRRNILERTRELTKRKKAAGGFDWQLEAPDDMEKQDANRVERPIPGNFPDMVKELQRLQEVAQDRANRLDDELKFERALNDGKVPKPTTRDTKELLKALQNRKQELLDMLKSCQDKERDLDAKGMMDPELEHELRKAEDAVDKTIGQIDKVLQSKGLLGKVEDDIKKIAAPVPEKVKVAIPEPKEIDLKKVEKEEEEVLRGLEEGLQEAKRSTDDFGTEVVPHGNKWWRFRWEYSYVEATIICLLCLIAAFWQRVHDYVRARLSRQVIDAPIFFTDHFRHIALATWVRFFWGELVVLLLTVMTLWFLARIGFFELWIGVQFFIITSINLPTEAVMYIDMSFNVAMQLIVAVMLFFLMTLQICYRALQNDRDCKALELGLRDELARHPVAENMIGKFASSPEEFAALKKGWLEGVAMRSSDITPRDAREEALQVCAVLDERGVLADGNHNAFPLWFFISQRVRRGVELTFTITACMWLLCFVTFVGFAMLHMWLHVAYIRISIVLALICVAVFVYMVVSINNMRSVTATGLTTWISPILVVACFQCPLFFLCFVATRLVVSIWMWVYFFKLALFFSVVLVAFLALFYIYVAPMIVAYLIKTSFPPHTSGSVRLVRDVMDENEIWKMREELRNAAPRCYNLPASQKNMVIL